MCIKTNNLEANPYVETKASFKKIVQSLCDGKAHKANRRLSSSENPQHKQTSFTVCFGQHWKHLPVFCTLNMSQSHNLDKLSVVVWGEQKSQMSTSHEKGKRR